MNRLSPTATEPDRSLPSWWLGIGVALAGFVFWRYAVDFARTDGWEMIDLDVYRWGGETARSSGDLYSSAYENFLLFTYTPFAAAVFMPMSLLAFSTLKVLMTVISLAALAVTAGVSLRSLGYRLDRGWAGATLALVAVGCSLEPVHETLLFGQINLVLMAVIVVDLLLPDTSRLKGIGVGIAAGFKLTPAIFIPYLLLTRRWAAAIRAGGAAAATVVVGFIVLPSESSDFWFNHLFIDSERVGGVAYVANQSVGGALIRALGSQSAASPYWWAAAIVLGGFGLWIAARVSRRGPELAGILTCALTGLLISPVSWSHHWVWAVPALALAVDIAIRRTPWAWLAAAGLIVAFTSFTWILFANLTPGYGFIWHVPARDDRELAWTAWQSVPGNLYVILGLVVLAATAWWTRTARTVGDTGAPDSDPSLVSGRSARR